jgi:hypothetical protein
VHLITRSTPERGPVACPWGSREKATDATESVWPSSVCSSKAVAKPSQKDGPPVMSCSGATGVIMVSITASNSL